MAFKKPATAVDSSVNFGDLSIYVSSSFVLPEGKYKLTSFDVRMHSGFGKDTSNNKSRLGVMISGIKNLDDPTAEIQDQFYSLGGNADKSFAPNPTGTGIMPVPGGAGGSLNPSTNWALFLKSLYDAGLPSGTFTNDVSVLNEIMVHMTPVPEPEERKGFQSQTGEAQEKRVDRKIPIVTEILEEEPTPAAKTPAKAPVKAAAPKPAAKAAPAPVAEESADEDVQAAAINGISVVLEKNPNGTGKLLLRTGTFKAVSDAVSGEMAQAVIETYFGNDDALNSILGQLGYSVQGTKVAVIA